MKKLAIPLFLLLPTIAMAWEGQDVRSGETVEIEEGNKVRPGENIELYVYDEDDYHDVDVESIQRYGSTVEVEVYDHDDGEYRTLEMED